MPRIGFEAVRREEEEVTLQDLQKTLQMVESENLQLEEELHQEIEEIKHLQ